MNRLDFQISKLASKVLRSNQLVQRATKSSIIRCIKKTIDQSTLVVITTFQLTHWTKLRFKNTSKIWMLLMTKILTKLSKSIKCITRS